MFPLHRTEKLVIVYDPSNNAAAIADGLAATFANEIASYAKTSIVANFLVIDNFRLLVKEGKFPHDLVEIHFKEHVIKIDQDGMFDKCIDGFGDYVEKVLLPLF